MSQAAQAILQEVLDQSHQYRANCALRHGLPEAPPRNTIDPFSLQEPTPPPTLQAYNATPDDASSRRKKALRTAALWAIGATTGLGTLGGAAGLVASLLSRRADQPPAVTAAPEQPGDLIRYLESQGYNLPPDGYTP